MDSFRIFLAAVVMSCLSLLPLTASADDELEVTMEVIDDLSDVDGDFVEMRGPDFDEDPLEEANDEEAGDEIDEDLLAEFDEEILDDFEHDDAGDEFFAADFDEDAEDLDEGEDVDIDEFDEEPMDDEPMDEEPLNSMDEAL